MEAGWPENAQILEKVAKIVAKQKRPKNFIKAQFESPKYLHQPSPTLLKCIQQTIFCTLNSPGPLKK
jgi:hypothetical protein